MKKIVIYCFLFFIAFSCFAQSQHPRLLFDEEDIEDIQDKINTYDCLWDYYEDLRDDAYDNRTTDFYNDRFKMHYGSDMAFVYLIENRSNEYAEFKNIAINSLTGMYDLALSKLPDDWPGSLEVCAALFHMSLIYDMLYDEMTFAERRQTATQIKTVIDSMLNWEWADKKLGKIIYGNNGSMHHASGIGIGIIAIKGDSLNDQTIFTEAMAAPYIDSANKWMEILDEGLFDTTGCSFEGVKYGVFAADPPIGYYEILKRDDNTDLFQNSNFKKIHEWLISELIPAKARKDGIDSSLFDFNPINSSFNWKNTYLDHYCAPSVTVAPLAAALGGIYQNEPTAGAATWLFERHLNILLNYTFEKAPANQFGTSNILAITKYANNAEHPDSIEEFPKTKFFSGRGLIVRDGYATDGTLFSFETNHAHNPESGGLFCRHDEDDNNSFTFFAYGRRWVIDCAQNSEYSKFHNTVLIDGYHQPHVEGLRPYFAADIQVTNWYDYHNKNNSYYIISDITDAWIKKKHHANPLCATCGGSPPYCDGIGIDYFYDEHTSYFPSWASNFSTSNRYRRHAQFIQKEGNLPPYIIIHDDIDLDNSNHDYTFLLHTGPGNTVGNFDQDLKKVRITSSDCIMDVYMSSVDQTIYFSTDNDDGYSWAVDPHKRLKFTATAVNPRFHAILIPSGSSQSAVSDLSYTNLNNQGSVATIEFSTGSQDVTDYSLFAYQKYVDYQGFALEGHSDPHPDLVSGVMGYCRLDETTDEFTNIFLSRGSYLKMEDKELINIAGRTARVILNDDEIDIYKVNPSSGRYSYKIHGKDVYQFKIYDVTYPFQTFNEYNYVKSDILIPDYYAIAVDTNEVKINWYCGEQHDIKIYYWDPANPDSIYTQVDTNNNSGNNFSYITLDLQKDWLFRLEGTMHTDNFIDLTDTIGISTIPEDLILQNITVEIDSTKNYQAFNSITAAGDSTYFTVEGIDSVGGNCTMEAGNYIVLQSGFAAKSGCHFWARNKNPVLYSNTLAIDDGPDKKITEPETKKDKKEAIPIVFSCSQNSPNPFNLNTTIRYGLPKNSNVKLTIFNIAGQAVKTLVNTNQSAGFKSVSWDGCNSAGVQMPQGIYFYVFKASDFEKHHKMILVR